MRRPWRTAGSQRSWSVPLHIVGLMSIPSSLRHYFADHKLWAVLSCAEPPLNSCMLLIILLGAFTAIWLIRFSNCATDYFLRRHVPPHSTSNNGGATVWTRHVHHTSNNNNNAILPVVFELVAWNYILLCGRKKRMAASVGLRYVKLIKFTELLQVVYGLKVYK